jgi:hypothetical protein
VAALGSDAERFYETQRGLADTWGIVLPSWDELSWDNKVSWENKLAEQIQRDEEAAHPRHD